MNYLKKEIVIPVVALIAIVCLVYMDRILEAMPDWGSETFLAVAAIASAVIAGLIFITTIWQIQQNQKHNKLSVKPLLRIEADYSDGLTRAGYFKLTLKNQGIGPAIIKNFILKFDGKKIACNNMTIYTERIKEKLARKGIKDLAPGFFMPDEVIEVGEERLLLFLEYDAKEYGSDGIKKLEFLIEYYSIYKEKTFYCSTEDIRKFAGNESE